MWMMAAAPLAAQVTIDTDTLPDARVGVLYDAAIPVSNKTTSHWCGTTAPLLTPPGLTVGMSCRMSGVASSAGTYSFPVHVSGPAGMETSRLMTVTVLPGVMFMYMQIEGSVGRAVSVSPENIRQGTPPYTFSLHGGQLAPGLNLHAGTGVVSGTPVTGGRYRAEIRATDAGGNYGVAVLDMHILGPAMELSPHPVTQSTLPPGRKGFPYSLQFSVSGGTPPYRFTTWTVNGLSMDAAGRLAGHAAEMGNYSLSVEARDALGNTTGNRGYFLAVEPGGAINFESLTAPKLGEAYLARFTVTGLGQGLQLSVTGSLPPGLTAEMGPGATEGRISGTPTTPGVYGFRIRVTDAGTAFVEQQLSFTLTGTSPTPLSINTSALPDAESGKPYSYTVPVSGGTPPYTFSASPLPAGLTCDPQTGTISGVTTASFQASVTVGVTDAVLGSVTKYLPFKVTGTAPPPPLTVTLEQGREAVVDWYYHRRILVLNAMAGLTTQLTGGALPPGIRLNTIIDSSPVLEGVPTQAGTFNFEITVTHHEGASGKLQAQIIVKPLTLTIGPGTLPDAVEDQLAQHTLTASGGVPPYRFSRGHTTSSYFVVLEVGTLVVYPQPVGERQVTVQVADAVGNYGSRTFSIRIVPGGLTVTGQPPNGRIHTAYETRFEASGGTPPYQFRHYTGELPPGMAVQADGRLTGTPTRAGTFRFGVGVSDANGRGGARQVELQIEGRNLGIQPSSLPQAISGEPYSVQFTASGGQPPYEFRMAESPAWRAGFQISSSGLLSGSAVVQQDERIQFRVEVNDAEGSFGSLWTSFELKARGGFQLGPAELPATVLGQAYLVHLQVAGGSPPYGFRIRSGGLPPGITMQSDGRISGVAQQEGAFAVTIEATEGGGATAVRSYTLVVGGNVLRMLPEQMPAMVVGGAVSVQLSGAGGKAPYRFEYVSGQVPAGLTLTTDGRLSGAPTAAGTYVFVLRMFDADERMVQRQYEVTVSVAGAPLSLGSPAIPALVVSVPVQFRFLATGGTPPYRFAVGAGRLPTGLSMDRDGIVEGVPAEIGQFVFTIELTHASGGLVSRSFTLTVSGAGVRIVPAVLPPAQHGVGYVVFLQGEGGRAPYAFRLGGGSLPPGFTLGSSGNLGGPVRFARTYEFEVRMRDASGQEATQQYQLRVEGAGLRLSPRRIDPMPLGRPHETDYYCDGGQPPYVISHKRGALPRGLAMNNQGQVRGTPVEAGVFSITVGCRDQEASEFEMESEYRVTGVAILPEALPEPGANGTLRVQLTTNPVVAGGTFAAEGLPQGLTLSAAGLLEGTPVAGGRFTVRVLAEGNVVGFREYTVSARLPLTLTTVELPAAAAGRFYSFECAAQGGRPPYRFEAAGLPAGLTLDAGGRMSGIPAEAGEGEIEVMVRDAEGTQASRRLRWKATRPALRIETTWLPAGRTGVAYEAVLVAAGEAAKPRWSLVDGGLPPGIALDGERGLLRGEPGESGIFRFTVRAQGEETAWQPLVLEIQPREAGSGHVSVTPAILSLYGLAGEAGRRQGCVTLHAAAAGPEATAALAGPGAAWAALETTRVRAPGQVCVAAKAEALTPGVWPATIELVITGGSPARMAVPVEFHVAAARGGVDVWPPVVEMTLEQGAARAEASLVLRNPGSVETSYQLSAGAAWVSPVAEWVTLAAGEAGVARLAVDGAGLTGGLHETTVRIRAAGEVVREVPVRMLAGGAAKRLAASAARLDFVAWPGGGAPKPQTVFVANAGSEIATPRVEPAGLPGWLQAGMGDCPAGGTCVLEVRVDPQVATPGVHRHRLNVEGAATALEIDVVLDVRADDGPSPAAARAQAVVLAAGRETSRGIEVAGSPQRAGPVDLLLPGAAWLAVTPARPVVDENGVARLTLTLSGQSNPGAGAHQATVLLRFANGEVVEVPVTLLVPGADCEGGPRVAWVEPAAGFRATVGEQIAVRAALTGCDGAVPAGRVLVGFEGRTQVLTALGDGTFAGGVIPTQASESAVLTLWRAGDATLLSLAGKVRSTGGEGPRVDVVKSGAGLAAPAVPGAPLRIEGVRLLGEGSVTGTLAEELGGVRVTLGGRALLLSFVSPGRIDAFVPPDVESGDVALLRVMSPEGESAPARVMVAAAHPGIFTADESGTGPALALHGATYLPVTESDPVRPGGGVRMFAVGLAGSPPVEVEIDGRLAAVESAEPLEGSPGVREVYFRVPDLSGAARQAVVRLRQGSLVSAPVGLFLRP